LRVLLSKSGLKNKTQSELAEMAGINRSTLIEFEQSGRANLITFIQLLRALDQLDILKSFHVTKELSPIQLAELQHTEKKRASKSKNKDQNKNKKSDW
jgi:transcriptional regulator with XRE-family HTH domain